MASTSGFNTGRQPENENASQEIPAPPSAPATNSVVRLFSSCFDWCSRFFSMRLDQSNSVASASTTICQSQNELTNAFQGMAPYPSTSGTKKLPYDVFINHRGPDVKKKLATTLYNTLNGMGLRVFLDSEELELGDSLPKELEEAMRSASLHLAIFSKNYAQSPWCLAELSFMLKTGTQIIPVFYRIQPDDVRYAKGVFADAFSRHEEKRRHTPEKIREWKNALYHVSYNIGHIVDTEDDEVGVLKNIINCVLKVIKTVPFVVAKHPVGLDEAVNDFEMTTIQSAEYNHRVQIVGLWGMGGSGKTTLAKHFYNNKYKTMERCGFLFDVREAAAKGELHNKQKELLECLGLRGVQVNSIEVGKDMLASELRSVRVLIVVDDVGDVEQLDALLPNTDSLGWGSLVVVTTREFEVLRSWGISTVYKMKPLDPHYAEQLFCWHAFLQSSPFQGFESLVKSFLNICDGLPLSLKIFGAQLYGNFSKDYWKHQLDKISRILPRNVIGRLKVSYDALDDEEKEIFLDIACFFIGEKKNLVINVWDGSRWNGLHCWERLFNKCLVELDDNDHIRMHDHLRDLGREIANQQSPYRLWFPHQIIKLYNQTQSIRIRGIASTTGGSTSGPEKFPRCSLAGEVVVDTNGGPYSLAPSSLGLKIFQVKGNYYNQIVADVSRELLWLRCFDIKQRNLRSFSSLANLRVLELHEQQGDSHLEELWETDSDAPVQLRGLIIFGCYNFKRLPNSIGCLSHLKAVVLNSARSLTSLPKEFCLLRWLEHLQIIWCVKLLSLPDSFGNLKNLRHLSLEGCQELGVLPLSFKDLIFLEHLDLNQCDKLTLRSDILESVRKLQYVNLSGCKQLEVLPSNITNQESLRTLDLRGCRSLGEVPMNIGQLSKLRVMEIGSELLTSLPNSLGDLSSLTDLRIENCPRLESLPDSVGCLNLLENLYIIFSGVTSLPISVRQLSNLHTLAIDNSLTSELNLETGSFTFSLCQLKCMYLSSIKVPKISISQDSCPGLETLQILNIHNLREIEVLPTTVKELDLRRCGNLRDIRGIAGLVNIRKLIIERCPELDVLPCFAQSASLQEFVFRGCYGVKKIQGLEYCKALEELRADTKWEVQGIESLESLEKLKSVELRANRRSGVESCIQSMQDLQKWPGEILLCTRAVSDAVSLVNSFAFPTTYLVDSFANKNIRSKTVLVQERLPNEDAVIVCFVINCTCRSMILNMILKISSMNSHRFSTEVEEGRWFWIGLFTQRSRNHVAQMYNINTYSGEGEVEKGLLLMGEEHRLMQAYRDLWALLAN